MSPKWEYEACRHIERKRDVCRPPSSLWQMMRSLTIGSWQKARGRGYNAGEVCARRLFCFFRLHLEEHRVCTRSVYARWRLRDTWRSRSSAFLNGNRLYPLFLFKCSFRRAIIQLEFQESKPKPEGSHSEQSQRHRRYTRCVLWEVTMYAHLPFKKLGFLDVQLWPIFLLKYSLTRALLHIEFRWSKPDESHSEKSKTETRKTAFCSSETPKSHAADGPAAAGCPVSNPDNNCANGLLGLCEYVTVHTILPSSPVILWIELDGKPKWLPLNFGYNDVMCTRPAPLTLWLHV